MPGDNTLAALNELPADTFAGVLFKFGALSRVAFHPGVTSGRPLPVCNLDSAFLADARRRLPDVDWRLGLCGIDDVNKPRSPCKINEDRRTSGQFCQEITAGP